MGPRRITLLVTGAKGLLGVDVARAGRALGHDVIGLGRTECDITDRAAVADAISSLRPDVVVNCAAFANVDESERNPDQAMRVNRDGAAAVVAAARKAGARSVHISTDYVFDGAATEPYPPGAEASPLSAYGRSKRAGEVAVLEADPEAMVVRTSWLFGLSRPCFPSSIVAVARDQDSIRVVDDQRSRATDAMTAASTVLRLIDLEARGIWHVANAGMCTKADLATEALRLAGVSCELRRISSAEWESPAVRPTYSVLGLEETEAAVGPMPDWKDGLAIFFDRMATTGAR